MFLIIWFRHSQWVVRSEISEPNFASTNTTACAKDVVRSTSVFPSRQPREGVVQGNSVVCRIVWAFRFINSTETPSQQSFKWKIEVFNFGTYYCLPSCFKYNKPTNLWQDAWNKGQKRWFGAQTICRAESWAGWVVDQESNPMPWILESSRFIKFLDVSNKPILSWFA